jgi:hypothetical protein
MTEKSCKTLDTGATSLPKIMSGNLLILSESQMFLYENNEWDTFVVTPLPKDLTV